ncbi:MAG: MBL fold metallo-hydrolase [Bryobacteraceae bacterium]|nr:MBL fold metallo-hydrolase [Bryobacteraceae bacterium]
MADAPSRLSIRVLGSGTSVGVPTIGCHCKVCRSDDPRDRRLRPSIAIRNGERSIVIDTGPDFRQQVLDAGIERLDAVLFTHAHADHILGLDDLRPFNFHQSEPIAIHSSAQSFEVIRRVFAYVFHDGPTESSRPKIKSHIFEDEPFEAGGLTFRPIPVKHGSGPCHGFRFANAAYLTDHSQIPDASLQILEGVEVLFLDALRYKPHPTHSTIDESLKTVARLKPRAAYFTHISHDLAHERAQSLLPAGVFLAYDGLEIDLGAAQ